MSHCKQLWGNKIPKAELPFILSKTRILKSASDYSIQCVFPSFSKHGFGFRFKQCFKEFKVSQTTVPKINKNPNKCLFTIGEIMLCISLCHVPVYINNIGSNCGPDLCIFVNFFFDWDDGSIRLGQISPSSKRYAT